MLNIILNIQNTFFIYTVELRWLKLEGTVKMCSSYRGPVISERKKIRCPWYIEPPLYGKLNPHGILTPPPPPPHF